MADYLLNHTGAQVDEGIETALMINNRVGSIGPVGMRNCVRNPRFMINQRNVSGTVTLSAGAFGHDCWKAGASGCTYTFATVDGRTTLTISAGSLIQTIDGADLFRDSNTYTLSWGGTCQGKIGSGSYSASGVTGSATGGNNIAIEFGTGTLYSPQFELGTVASSFSAPVLAIDLAICCRYARVLASFPASTANATTVECYISLVPPMRSAPSASLTAPAKFEDPAVTTYTQSSAVVNVLTGATARGLKLQYPNFSGMTAGNPGGILNTGGLTILSADI